MKKSLNNKNIKYRDELVDVIRGLAILMVILGHTISYNNIEGYENSIIFRIIWSLQMPLFMLISGYVTKYSRPVNSNKSLIIYIARRTYSYLVPWLVWTVFVRWMLVGNVGLAEIPQHFVYILNHMDNGYWFLFSIWHLCIIWGISQYVANRFRVKSRVAITLLLSILIGILSCGPLILIGGTSFLAVKYTCYYLPFYLLGYIVANLKLDSIKVHQKNIVIFVSFILYTIILCRCNVYALGDSFFDIFIRYICSITGCIIIIHMASELMKLKKSYIVSRLSNIVAVAGRESIGLYVAHNLFLNMIENKNAIMVNSIDAFVFCTLNYILTLIVTTIAVYAINRVNYGKKIFFGKW